MKIILFTLALAIAGVAGAQEFVTLQNGLAVWVEKNSTDAQQTPVILLNGLTYSTKQWVAMRDSLIQQKVSVITYDPRGMGKTLEKNGPVKTVIPLAQQVEDLYQLMGVLNISRAHLVGLSYGGALGIAFAAVHPEKVEALIPLAPYVRPLEQQDRMLQQKVVTHHMMHPTDKRSDDEIYDQYLHDYIFQYYPIYEPTVKEHPWRLEAVFQMVVGIRHLDILALARKIEIAPVHMVTADKDQYVPKKDHEDFWRSLSARVQVSRLNILGSEHKIPEAQPKFAAAWIKQIVTGNGQIKNGRSFVGDPVTHKATSGQDVIALGY